MENLQENLEKLLEEYNYGYTYYEFKYNDMTVKIRFNKDHSRNHERNDEKDVHNLSLINRKGNGASEVDSFFVHEDRFKDEVYLQKQVWNVIDQEDLKREFLEFIEDIDGEN